MGVFISIRKSSTESFFKEWSHKLIELYRPDEILICSGFFQHNQYFIAPDSRDASTRRLCDVLMLAPTQTITIVGHYSKPGTSWSDQYHRFVEQLRAQMAGQGNVNAYEAVNGHWHAKEMIMLKNGEPVAGIIGSSNFTHPAYGSGITDPFNVEADTYIFSRPHEELVYRAVQEAQLQDDGTFIMVTRYDPVLNKGRDEMDLLRDHYNYIMNEIANQNNYRPV